MDSEPYLQPGKIGQLTLHNRLVRAATSETMASSSGEVTQELVDLYGDLARGGAGLLISGHMYVEAQGQYNVRQMGIHADYFVPGLKRLADSVHAEGGKIFAELSHAGSQSVVPSVDPVAPSTIPNAMFSRQPRGMTEDDIGATIAAFAAAARRAISAGFDGIHIHGGNGYLISQFSSPMTNRRRDGWGGDTGRRALFFLSVYDGIRAAVGPDVAVTARLGVADAIPNGLPIEEGVRLAAVLRNRGLDAVEPTYGLMASYLQNIRLYVGVSPYRALQDWVVPRLWAPAGLEGYYRSLARAIKSAVDLSVILVGGIRSTDVMADILRSGDADFLALARPFIREPNFPNELRVGRRGMVDCVSCNICLMYDGIEPIKCWRKNPFDLAKHVYHRILRS
jgi:2,4-dienoyl-CoA reductase-like NADH-dependent reductase (Old Yellow Enzyme family)